MNSQTNDGGPAFPSAGILTPDGIAFEGMSLRDFFAAAALQGVMMNASYFECMTYKRIAECAWNAADAMLAARDGKGAV